MSILKGKFTINGRGDELFLIIVPISTVIIIVGLLYLGIVSGGLTYHKRPGQTQCEDSGGIFYQGGFGADNCVFPPIGGGK